nr:GNAT family N-acetyltransferase [Hydrogenophilus thermoluteolus]
MRPAPIPTIRKASQISGKTLVFRDVCLDDADFILSLRTDEQKSRYLSMTKPDLKQQQEWIQRYLTSRDQAYFVIATKEGELIGTVRLYDAQGDSFCWGSWIIKSGAPMHAAIESALMVYAYAIDFLGFSCAHFDVRKGNERVWRFHERFGATRVGENALDYYYRIEPDAIEASRKRYRKYLPDPIIVEWL